MRKSFFLSLIVFVSLAGCNSSTSTSGTTQMPHTMTATVNGQSWSSAGNFGAYATRFALTKVTITGVAADSSQFTIVIPNLKFGAVGTDLLGWSSGNYAMFTKSGVPDTSKSYLTIPTLNQTYSGSVTITAYDTTKFLISGTFQFVARKANNHTDSVTVTNGSFYQLQFAI